MAEDPVDPYELVRRLSIIQAEESLRELERKRTDWETELLESRGVRQTQIRNRTQTAPDVPPHTQHKRAASISLAPNQLPPPAYTDLPEPPRKHSLCSSGRHNAAGSRRPSLKRGDSGDLATINENAVVDTSMQNLFPECTENQRRRPSALPRVDEDCAPQVASTLWQPRRRSSLLSQTAGRQQDCEQSDNQLMPRRRTSSVAQSTAAQPIVDDNVGPEFVSTLWKPRRRSSAISQTEGCPKYLSQSNTESIPRKLSSSEAQKEHKRQDWSQADEASNSRSRKSSLIDKLEHYWKPGQADASDDDAFDSKASTLRNSWRSSMGDSTSSRRPSMLKKIGEYWVVSPPSSDEQPSVKNIHTDEDASLMDNPVAKRKSSLFSKLRH